MREQTPTAASDTERDVPLPSPPAGRWRRAQRALARLSLYTPYRGLTRSLWRTSVAVDRGITRPKTPIAEIDAAHFSRETLRRATNDFWEPAVVRGLFRGAPALETWPTLDYLPSTTLGERVLPVIADARYGTNQDDRENLTFREAFLQIVQHQAQKYLFFPVESRFQMESDDVVETHALPLRDAVAELVRQDLPLDRIWPGFAGPDHRHFMGAQMVIGYGHQTPAATTGTIWHCAVSNNYFAQIAGRKRWFFLPQRLGHHLHPIRNGVVSMMAGSAMMPERQRHLPISYVDLEPGDLLYNPYWMWHAVMNHEGLNIGVPLREFDVREAFAKNAHFTSIVLVNKLALRLFDHDIGGYGDDCDQKRASTPGQQPDIR